MAGRAAVARPRYRLSTAYGHGAHPHPYTVALVAGAVLVASGANLVALSVGVQVMNALLLPIVLGFLYLLARRLPPPYRLRGAYALIVALTVIVTAGFGGYAALTGLGASS